MIKAVLISLLIFIFSNTLFSQRVTISIAAPKSLTDRRAVLLTREKGFAAIVHSIQLGFDTTHLQMDKNLLPDLYQFQISQMKGSLTFFFESGTQIKLDTANLSQSKVTHSKSNVEWRMFQDSIQLPSDKRANAYLLEEGRARKKSKMDSVAFWLNRQEIENQDLLDKMGNFIAAHPRSYVSLYLLKNNWFALKNKGLFEKLDPAMAPHKNYKFLKERKGIAKN
jgi:hypothetical protein